MAIIQEEKKVICKYGTEEAIFSEYLLFGWLLSSRALIFDTGKIVPEKNYLTEYERKEKCSWEFVFTRKVEEKNVERLHELQKEYVRIKLTPNKISYGLSRAIAFLSFVLIALIVVTIYGFAASWPLYVSLPLLGATVVSIGLIAFLVTLVMKKSKKIKQLNIELKMERSRIVDETLNLLK